MSQYKEIIFTCSRRRRRRRRHRHHHKNNSYNLNGIIVPGVVGKILFTGRHYHHQPRPDHNSNGNRPIVPGAVIS